MRHTGSSTADHGDDAFLARLMLELENAVDPDEVILRYCEERPDRADDVRHLLQLDKKLEAVSPRPFSPPRMPERLGEFRILRLIAVGGMGEVYEADQDSLGSRKVAIKVIRRGFASPESIARFQTEQNVLALLHETHIVPIHAAGEHDGLNYFAMPYIRGATLSNALDTSQQWHDHATMTPPLNELASQRLKSLDTSADGTVIHNDGSTLSFRPPPRSHSSVRKSLGNRRLNLSMPYFRSVAEAMVQVADGVQYAHDAGYIHRDLKPSNIMIDCGGHCWIIDFGLASHVATTDRTNLTDNDTIGPEKSSGLAGTWPYIAPEQAQGKSEKRSDVYGLGATLYELCTLRPPFVGRDVSVRSVQEDPLLSPLKLVGNLPRDLSAICEKATGKLPADRYQNAREFGDDLKRWLRYEPVRARPAHAPRRLWLWSRRKPGWAAAVAMGVLALSMVFWLQQAAIKASNDRNLVTLAYRAILQIRFGQRRSGWFKEVASNVRRISTIDSTMNVRSMAVSNLAGLDAYLEEDIDVRGSSVAFDKYGKSLLIGGTVRECARIWNQTSRQLVTSKLLGEGYVTFSESGGPQQIVVNGANRLSLYDINTSELLREFSFPDSEMDLTRVVISPSGRMIGATGRKLVDQQWDGIIAVWNRDTGAFVQRFDHVASAIAFSPDDALIAVGDERGRLLERDLKTGQQVRNEMSFDSAEIKSLAYGPEPRMTEEGEVRSRWLLAAGDSSGTIVVWDLIRRQPRSICRGSSFHVQSIEFSPDGMTVGSVGRTDMHLWDATTGAPLLSVRHTNWMTDLAFSPDGKRVAVSSDTMFGDIGKVSIWKLESGRGIQTLRGLGTPINKVFFSPDDRRLAAISQDGRIAVWDLMAEQLLHVFQAPRAEWIDNATVAFDAAGERLAFTGSNFLEGQGKLWDVETGAQLASWHFAPGLNNQLAFRSDGSLLLFQMELESGRDLPDSRLHPRDYPRVGRVYELEPGKEPHLRFPISDFRWGFDYPRLLLDGRCLATIGLLGDHEFVGKEIKIFDTTTGKESWSAPVSDDTRQVTLDVDRSTRFLSVRLEQSDTRTLIYPLQIESGKLIVGLPQTRRAVMYSWNQMMPYEVHSDTSFPLSKSNSKDLLVLLDREQKVGGTQLQLSQDGGRFAAGNADGTVSVFDFHEIRRRLKQLGVGW